MISDQLDAFPGHERFVHALLGMLSSCDAVVEALATEREDGGRCPDGALLDVALGVVSLARTLRATLSAPDAADASAPGNAGPTDHDAIEPVSLLR